MKSTCPACKGHLYFPNNHQSLRKWSVLCARCHAIYVAYPGTVVGAWLCYSHRQQALYEARISLQTGENKTVRLKQFINVDESVVVLTPLKGLGKQQPILLIEPQTERSYFLNHSRQHVRRYQLYRVIGMVMAIVWLSLFLKGAIDVIVIAVCVSGLAVAIAISGVHRGKETSLQIRDRLLLEQRLIRHSDEWGQRLQQIETELSRLRRINQRLLPYDENHQFGINSPSKEPRNRPYFEHKYYLLSELIECCKYGKNLIDTNVSIIQLTGEVPIDMVDQIITSAQEIERLEGQYQAIVTNKLIEKRKYYQ